MVCEGRDYCHQISSVDPNLFFNPPQTFEYWSAGSYERRAEAVREAFVHAWGSYTRFAWGHDNVEPLTFRPSDTWGLTLVDALDTLLLMGLDAEYDVALKAVAKINFTRTILQFYNSFLCQLVNSDCLSCVGRVLAFSNKGPKVAPVMVFESIIRYLGGLLGAYDLRPDPILLKQAVTLANTLLPAFETGTGFPAHKLDLLTGSLHGMDGRGDRKVCLAEIGTLQLEFHRLSQLTEDPIYATIAQKIIDRLDQFTLDPPGLYPLFLDMHTGSVVSGAVSFGAMGDSFYEYLLKRYLLTNRTEGQYLRMYVESIDSLHKHLVEQRESEYDSMFLLAELGTSGQPVYRMDHLDFLVGQELASSCRQLYQMTATGLGPESVGWTPTPTELANRQTRLGVPIQTQTNSVPSPYRRGFHLHDARYLLRPETVESIFYMYRLTGDPTYQAWAWEIFQAINARCRVDGGFAEYHDVREAAAFSSQRPLRNAMESFFLAETLKYLYLTFMPPSHLNLQEYVLTTEAHPLRITS
ncbi:hypothetical protein L0F63_001988 [Massospora cicadina]|nr:hypothetical protein L0F63_001988 [Massospora cicadina]